MWSSSNPNVATVVNGFVTAISAGVATITATAEDGGKTASCAVTVSNQTTDVEILNMQPFRIYPNPTKGLLQIDNGDWNMDNVEYIIYNAAGYKIMQGRLQGGSAVINVESLSSGMYFLVISGKTVKFVKE